MSKIQKINLLPIVNAKRKLKIDITPRDIKSANRKSPSSCVVSQACKGMEHIKEIRTHLSRTYVRSNEGNWVRYMTPRSLRDEIIAFDRGGSFEPGTYVLEPPPKNREATGKRQGSNKRKKTGRRRRSAHVISNVRGGPATTSFF